MQLALRPYVTAGIAVVGAGLVAVTPVTAPLPDVQVRNIALTASDLDVIGPWVDAFNTASANLTGDFQFFATAPAAALQQVIVNQFTDVNTLLTGGSVSDVIEGIGTNLQNAFTAATFQGDFTDVEPFINSTLTGFHSIILQGFNGTGLAAELGLLPELTSPTVDIVNFTASPLSGVLFGMIGPLISPFVAALNSVEAVADNLTGSAADPDAALQALVSAPADIVGSLFNGATLNLDALIPLIEQADILPLPPGLEFTGLSLAFGGLLSPGGGVGDVGGSIFNSLGLVLDNVPILNHLNVVAEPIGPIGALENLGQMLATAIGWDNGVNPLEDLPALDFSDIFSGF